MDLGAALPDGAPAVGGTLAVGGGVGEDLGAGTTCDDGGGTDVEVGGRPCCCGVGMPCWGGRVTMTVRVCTVAGGAGAEPPAGATLAGTGLTVVGPGTGVSCWTCA